MPSVTASAPAKVILFGEHSVVYGAPAVAASIDRRTTVELKTTTDSALEVHFPKTSARFLIPLPEKLEHKTDPQSEQSLQCIKLIYDSLSKETKRQGIIVNVSSNFPVGAGLGSSASFSLATSAAFLCLDFLNMGKSCLVKNSCGTEVSRELLHAVRELSHKCEELFHGKPSGIDTSTCLLGGIIQFQKGCEPQKIADTLPFKVAIVDSKVARNTANVIRDVSELRQRLEITIDGVYDTMRSVAESAISEIKKNTTNLVNILDLVRINQGLLYALGVSHPVLDQIGVAVADLGVAFKLTGAGRGGNALIFIPPEVSPETVTTALEKYSYTANIVNIGAPGLSLTYNVD